MFGLSYFAGVAQLVEHLICNQEVAGSSPTASSILDCDQEVLYWNKYHDCRREGFPSGQREQTVNLPPYGFEGSNPSPSTVIAGVAQLVELQPSKLNVASSNLVARSIYCRNHEYAHVAQW